MIRLRSPIACFRLRLQWPWFRPRNAPFAELWSQELLNATTFNAKLANGRFIKIPRYVGNGDEDPATHQVIEITDARD